MPTRDGRHLSAGLRHQRGGHIVNIASIGGLVTMPGLGAYAVSKFGIVALSETLRKNSPRPSQRSVYRCCARAPCAQTSRTAAFLR